MLLLNHLELTQITFLSRIFHKNSQTIRTFVLFESQYEKYLCKKFSLWNLWTYPL